MHLIGGLAQLVERVLSMHEVLGSIPKFSILKKDITSALMQIWTTDLVITNDMLYQLSY